MCTKNGKRARGKTSCVHTTYIHTCKYINKRIYIYIYVYIYMYIYIYIVFHMQLHVATCTNDAYLHTHMYTHTYRTSMNVMTYAYDCRN